MGLYQILVQNGGTPKAHFKANFEISYLDEIEVSRAAICGT